VAARRDAQAAVHHPPPRPQSPCLGGLWETWHDVDTFTIVTTAANKPMRAIHDRMPLILADDQIDEWLDPENPDPHDVLASLPSEGIRCVELRPLTG
jgi:putative SOS response-associated peptidase YedK